MLTFGLVASLGSIAGGPLWQGIALDVLTFASAASLVTGVLTHKPRRKGPWLCMAAADFMFATGFLILLAQAPHDVFARKANYHPAHLIFLVGYLVFIAGTNWMSRARAQSKDPMTIIDALILTGGVGVGSWVVTFGPILNSVGLAVETKTEVMSFGILSIVMFFTGSRLMMSPGEKNFSFSMMVARFLITLVTVQTASLHEINGWLSEGMHVRLIPCIGAITAAVAALHPSMRRVLTPAPVDTGRRMTSRRLALMTLAVVEPLALMLYEPTKFDAFLVPYAICMTSLVMIRFGGMVRAGERITRNERVLSRTAAALVSTRNAHETNDVALSAMEELASVGGHLRYAIVLRDGEAWKVADARGFEAANAIGRRVVMDPLINANNNGYIHLYNAEAIDVAGENNRCTGIALMMSRDELKGALVVTSDRTLGTDVREALVSLAADVSLASDALTLAEDLHVQRSDKRFRALIEQSNDIILVFDDIRDGFKFMSPAAEKLLGMFGDPIGMLQGIHEEDRVEVIELVKRVRAGAEGEPVECRVGEGDQTRWFELKATDLRSLNDIAGVVINAHEITERKRLEEGLRHKVLHDHLTGVANRTLLHERVDLALHRRRSADKITALLFIDLDDFKTVNDGLGHAIGDELLISIADRLKSVVRLEDTPARLGGDEFAVLLEGIDGVDIAYSFAQRLLETIRLPMVFAGREVTVGASIGIAIANDQDDADVLLRNADVAMYHAKWGGKNAIRLFDDSMYRDAMDRLELKGDLETVLQRNELEVFYQPIVGLPDGNVSGFEALLRWRHPVRGFVSPLSFIPLAEETGLIVPIGAWTLREAANQLATWRSKGPDCTYTMNVNVSPRQLEDPNIVNTVAKILEETGIDPAWLTLELTETAVLDGDDARARLAQLRDLGVRLAADDFGAGFASYAALQQLPFTCVKIDGTLINGLALTNGRAEAQIGSIVEMAHSTGLSVVAECVEKQEQMDSLAQLGCDGAQGYFFGRPLSAEEMF